MQNYFNNIGYISVINRNSTIEFIVSTIKYLINIIIPHFDKYPLQTKNRLDFLLFKEIILLISNKKHNSLESLQKIINLKASLNLGLSVP